VAENASKNEFDPFYGHFDISDATRRPREFRPTMQRPVPSLRCTGVIRSGPKQGEQCPNWAVLGTHVCLSHGAQVPNVRKKAEAVLEAARMRLIGNVDAAIDTLEALLDPSTADHVRLKASTEILDRVGVRGGMEVNHTGEVTVSAADEVRKRLEALAGRVGADADDSVVDAEVVESLPEPLEALETRATTVAPSPRALGASGGPPARSASRPARTRGRVR